MTDRLGELAIDGDRTTITFMRHLPHPIERVRAALTDPLISRAGSPRHKSGLASMRADNRRNRLPEPADVTPRSPPNQFGESRPPESGCTAPQFTHSAAPNRFGETFHQDFPPGTGGGPLPDSDARRLTGRIMARLDDAEIPDWSDRYASLTPSYPAWS